MSVCRRHGRDWEQVPSPCHAIRRRLDVSVSLAAAVGSQGDWRVESAVREAEKVGLVDGGEMMTLDWHLTMIFRSSLVFYTS